MKEVDEKGFAEIDGTRVGREFLSALSDPTDADVTWVRRAASTASVHPTGDEVHAVHLAEWLANLIRESGVVVSFTAVPGKHPNIREVPHDRGRRRVRLERGTISAEYRDRPLCPRSTIRDLPAQVREVCAASTICGGAAAANDGTQ